VAKELAKALDNCLAVFWRKYQDLSHTAKATTPIASEDLKEVFVSSINPVDPALNGFDVYQLLEDSAAAATVPDHSDPSSAFSWLNDPFTSEDIEDGKCYLKLHCANSSPGMDGILQCVICAIDTDELRDFGNACIEECDFCSVFLVTVFIAIAKRQ
jgi:hypothetical protein